MSIFTSNAFIDGVTSAIPSSLIYLTGALGENIYTTASLPNPANTSATQRIGESAISTETPTFNFETTDTVGGVRLGSVTVFENGEPAEQINMSTFDGFRTGKNISSFRQFGGSTNVRPMIRISPEGFFEKNDEDKINHFASFNNFGMGMHYKTVDENFTLIPFNDFSKIVAFDLIGRASVFAYPFVHNGRSNLDQFTDPSHPGNDGAIDVFEVRNSLVNLSHSDIRIYGCHGSYQAGGIEGTRSGGIELDSKYEIVQGSKSYFLDSQETEFSGFSFPKVGLTGSSGYSFAFPGFINDSKYKLSPFNEDVDHLKNSYAFTAPGATMINFLSASRNSISAIGARFKSTTCGLVYGESNSLGTDSIAFGGLKK